MMETIRKKYPLDKAGFSFAELMIVMAIVAILAAIATPSILRGLPEKRLRSAARNLYADLQKARLLAVKENRTVTVRFHPKDPLDQKDQDFYYFDDDKVGETGYKEWNTDEFRRNLANYTNNGEVVYGSGSAGDGNGGGTCKWTTTPEICKQADDFSFSYQGTTNSGTVYLQNNNDDICYALSVSDYGNVKIRRFNGKSWDEK